MIFGGGGKDPNKAAMKIQKRQMARLDAIDLPELEEFILQSPELVGLLDAEQMENTAFEQLQEDESLRQAQMDALRQMRDLGEVGLTPEERAQRNAMLRESAAQNQAQQKQILQSMAQRGNLDSGASLIAQLQANAQQGMDARRQSEQMAADVSSRRRDAINRAAGMAGQMSQRDLAMQGQQASARDRIAQFNAQQRAGTARANLAARQAIANQQTAIANQQSQVANQIAQQNFQNQLSRATGQGSVANNMSQIAANAPQRPGALQAGLSGAATGATIGESIGGPVGAGYGAAVGGGVGILSSLENGGVVHAKNGLFDEMMAQSMGISQPPQNYVMQQPETGTTDAMAAQLMKDAEDAMMGREYDTKIPYRTGINPDKAPERKEYVTRNEPVEPKKPVAKKAEPKKEESKIDGEGLSKGLSALSEMMKAPERQTLDLGPQQKLSAENIMQLMGQVDFQNPFMAEDGGLYDDTMYAQDGSIIFDSDGGGSIVGGDSFERDRVDARLNSGEAVLNVAQQQRLMDLLRGKETPESLGDEDIVEGVPKDYQEDLTNKIDNKDKMSKGLKRLIEALGE